MGIMRKILLTPVGDASRIGPGLCRMRASENAAQAKFAECLGPARDVTQRTAREGGF